MKRNKERRGTRWLLSGLASLLMISTGAMQAGAQQPVSPKYEPTWESIRRHPLPQWFHDAKFGIFIHWGVYSVPAWAPPTGELGKVDRAEWFTKNPYAEWYLNTLKIKDSPTYEHHGKTYGANFDYLDFIPIFNQEVQKWNPEEWARLFRQVGAKYVVLTTKHHDGFALWPTRVPHPRRKPEQRSARRDIVGELTRAVRAQGLRMGLYYSGGLDWSFVETPIVDSQDIRRAVPQMEEYARYADAQWRELMEFYQPDILWNDITYPQKGDLLGILSEYYNRHPDGVVNNRFGVEFSDFTTPEYATYDKIREKKWESCRGLGFSFGYNQAEAPGHMLSADQLVDLLVDIVSKNGNLLLNIGPRADGSISELQLERLRALGDWLAANGEAIYGTRPWVRPSSRTTEGVEVRFTRKGESIYAILLDKPKASTIVIESLYAAPNTTIELLSVPGSLPWSQRGKDLELTLPGQLPGAYAYVLRITPTPWQLVKD